MKSAATLTLIVALSVSGLATAQPSSMKDM